jgi:hypothetical protein
MERTKVGTSAGGMAFTMVVYPAISPLITDFLLHAIILPSQMPRK